ncbi:MAG: PAS domain S-box protein [Methanobacteriota archaeon]
MSVSELALALNMSRNTVGKYLELMHVSGVVDVRAMGKAKSYFLSPRVPATRVLSYLKDAVIQTDDRYRIVHVNLTALDLLSSDEDDLTGRNLLDLLSIQGLTDDMRAHITDPSRDVAFSAEIEVCIDGNVRHLWMTVADMVMYDGVSGYTFIFEDISEWKEAEEERRMFKFLFTTLAHESWERVCLFSPDLTIRYGNRQFASADGSGSEEPEGSSMLELYDKYATQAICDAVESVIESQGPRRLVFQVMERDSPCWLDTRLYPVPDDSGSIKTILGITRDVTGLQEGGSSSVLLSVLLDTMSEGVLTVTAGGTILSWNRGAEHITGYPAEELLGGTAQIIIPPELNGGQDVIIDAVRGVMVCDLRMTIRAKGGRKKKVILSSAVVPDHAGEISLVTLVWREP